MATLLRSLTLVLLLVLPFVAKADDKQLEGLWGGKWDDMWPVFIAIHAGEKPGEYVVEYSWLENTGDSSFSHQKRTGHRVGNHLEAGSLILLVDEHGGLLYGAFENPRMANLVRIMPETTTLETVELESKGWKVGAIPAVEALKKIKTNDPK